MYLVPVQGTGEWGVQGRQWVMGSQEARKPGGVGPGSVLLGVVEVVILVF